ncbi:MAG: hypothetical protein ACYS8W_06495 [Planctomycetota bacterium]|jgi:hypothetical protein
MPETEASEKSTSKAVPFIIGVAFGMVVTFLIVRYAYLPGRTKDVKKAPDAPTAKAGETNSAESGEKEATAEGNVKETPSESSVKADIIINAGVDGLTVNGKQLDSVGIMKEVFLRNATKVQVNMDDEADASLLGEISMGLVRSNIRQYYLAGADGKKPSLVNIPEPQPVKKDNSGVPTIDLQEVRVKLLWYSPRGIPRYTGDDGHAVLKIRSNILHKNKNHTAEIDWDELRDFLKKRAQDYKPPPDNPMKKLPVVIDARKYVPVEYVGRVLEVLIELNIRDIQFAAPEIGY